MPRGAERLPACVTGASHAASEPLTGEARLEERERPEAHPSINAEPGRSRPLCSAPLVKGGIPRWTWHAIRLETGSALSDSAKRFLWLGGVWWWFWWWGGGETLTRALAGVPFGVASDDVLSSSPQA